MDGKPLQSSFGTMEHSSFLDDKFREERLKDLQYYAPKEVDLSLSVEERRKYCDEWTRRGLKALIDKKISDKTFSEIIEDASKKGIIKLRKNAEKLFEFSLENKVPLYVLSAGLGNVIEPFLLSQVKCYKELQEKELVKIVSNRIYFDESGLPNSHKDPPLNTFTKTDYLKEAYTHGVKDAIIAGDHHHDSLCVEKLTLNKAISIAFINSERKVLENEKKEQLERYSLHWDGAIFDEGSFDFHLSILNHIKLNCEQSKK